MSKIDLNQLNDIQYDVLKEIGNIGAGNATTALSKMLNQKMDMSVPKVELVPFNEISDIMGDEDQTVVGIMLGFEGDVYGMMMFLFDTKSAHHLVNTLMMQDTCLLYTSDAADEEDSVDLDGSGTIEKKKKEMIHPISSIQLPLTTKRLRKEQVRAKE